MNDNEMKFFSPLSRFQLKRFVFVRGRNLFNNLKKVFDKIFLKKLSEIASVRGKKEEMKRSLITSKNRGQRSET